MDVLNPGALSKVVGLENNGGVAGGQTFNTGDVINNAKEVAITFSGNSTVAADVNNVTSFNGTMLANATINAALFDSVANVNNAGGGLGNTLTVTNGDAAATYGIVGDTSAAGINVTLRAAQLAGTADAVKFAVTGAGSIVPGAAGAAPAAVNVAVLTSAATGVEKITVATSGTNVFSLTAASTGTDGTTLEVTGSGNNTITASGLTNVATYDMSTSTGTNTLNVAGALTTSDVVKGGTGADTLRVAQASTAANLSVTGVETLRLSTGSATGSMIFSTAPSFTTVRVDGDTAESGVQTLTNLGNAAVTVDYRGEGLTASAASQQQFNSLTINNSYTGSSDTVAVKVSNGTIVNTVGYNLGTLSISGAETLDINAADVNATATTTFTAITDSTLTNLKVTTAGAVNLGTVTAGNVTNMGVLTQLDLSAVAGLTASSVTLANNSVSSGTVVLAAAGGTTLVLGAESTTDSVIYTGAAGVDTISGSNFTGSLVVDGKGGADQITSGTGNDSLTGGEGADFIFGGTGNDTIILTETVAAIDTVRLGDTVAGALATDADTVTGFAAANDLLQVSRTDLGAAFTSVAGAGFSVATDFVTIAGGVATAASDRLIYNSTNGQLTYDADGNGGGAAVLIATLTGVPTITAANFVVIA